ncbi:hypothetical protein J4E85_010945 [Alternaria conjuncta]|uniref:uncharacterized protein n=1 Tax=Alternaria conjuncta TaxID=181017 RepID=UPI00221EEBD4|nr:uncharacterized protein J4E85_010945 [Alternaria conjuncta]KAI4912970.1 hypothetical protein J4E85_010945 [Alternaria conjuncta]
MPERVLTMERVFTKEDSAISPATGKAISQHEAAGLKSLTKEQHLRFWEEVIYWNKERFTEAKWRQAKKDILRAKKEHCMKVLGWCPPPPPVHSIVTPGGRQLLFYSSSSWTAPTGAHPLRPAHLPRFETASPTTPRPRWEILSSGPGTPRSATAGPVKNSFAQGGFWESLISPKTPVTAIPIPTTPVTAVPPSPWLPNIPSIDAEAKATYEDLKASVSKMALKVCASRHTLRRSFNSDNDVIHPSMVRPKDTFLAAQLTLGSLKLHQPLSTYIDASPGWVGEAEGRRRGGGGEVVEWTTSRPQWDVLHPNMVKSKDRLLAAQVTLGSLKLHQPLSTYIDASLPQKLDSYADDETAGAKQYRINRREQLDDVDSWLQFDAQTGELTTILEAQRDLLKMNKDRRKSREVAVGEKGIKLAWAVKVVDDCQYFADIAADGESEGSDEGYEYGNFVRSLGDGDGSSLRSNSSTLDLTLTLTNSSNARSSATDENLGLTQRSSSSPIKPTHDPSSDTLPLRSRNYTLSNLSNTTSPNIYTPPPSHAHSIRRSNATATPSSSASRRNRQGSLWINTSLANPSVSAASTMSPQERGTRHKGPSIEDLSGWAEELKKMERKRLEMRGDGGVGRIGRPVGAGKPRQLRWFSNTEGGDSEDESRVEKKTAHEKEEEKADEEGDGLTINGSVHPALREGGHDTDDGIANWRNNVDLSQGEERNRGASGGSTSTASWRCETASIVERESRPSSIDMDNEVYDTGDDDQAVDHDNDHEIDNPFDEANNPSYLDASDSDTNDPPTRTPRPTTPVHPQRTSSLSPTHAPIKMSALSTLRAPASTPVIHQEGTLRLDPPRRPPPPNRPPPPPMPYCNMRPPAPRPTAGQISAVPSSSSFIEMVKRQGQGRDVALSSSSIEGYEKQDGKEKQRSASGGVSKATLLQEAVHSRSGKIGAGSQHTRMWSKSSGNAKDDAKSKEEEEWDEELKRMEGRERARQISDS